MSELTESQRADRDYEFQKACMEYREVSENIRRGWSYITTLIRQFILIQILLIGLVGLGNTAITSAKSLDSGEDVVIKQSSNNKKLDNNKVPLSFKQEFPKLLSVGILIGIGLFISIGARIQSKRLFLNARAFVVRAAALEHAFGVGDLRAVVSDRETANTISSHHRYMLDRLENRHGDTSVQMGDFLSRVFVVGAIVWGVILIIFTATTYTSWT